MSKGHRRQVDVFDTNEVNDILRETFYKPKKTNNRKSSKKVAPKPDHYDVICISLYKEDLAQLDKMVRSLKKKGHRKMSRSALIRFALDQVDLSGLPRAY